MANLTSLLRDEITRLARRQINAEIVPLKKRWAQQRRMIAALKEECGALRRELSQLSKRGTTVAPKAAPGTAEGGATRRRFRADGLRSFRVRLGLTVREVAGPSPVRVVIDPRGTLPSTARGAIARSW